MSQAMEAALPNGRRSFGLWHYVWKLLRLRLVIFWSGLRRSKTRRKVTLAVATLVVLGLAAFLFWLSTLLLGFLQTPQVAQYIDLRQVIAAMPSTMITLAFFLFLLTNFAVLLQVLYLSNDMDFLLSAPLPMRAVFLAKLIQGLLPNFGLVCLFALPLMFGLGARQGYNALFYPLVVVTLALVSMLGAGISALLVMAVVRLVPARRLAEVLGFFGALISLLLSQSGQLFAHVQPAAGGITDTITKLTGIDQPWSPLAWAGRGLVALGEGNWLVGVPLLLLSLAVAGGLFWAALALAERLYYSGWARMQVSPRKKKLRRAAAAPIGMEAALPGRSLFGRIPAPVRAVVTKDWRLLRRDLRNLSQLIAPLIFTVIYAFSTLRGFQSISQTSDDIFTSILAHSQPYISLALPMFFGWSFLVSLAINAFSREGKSYWMLKAAPLSTGRLVAAKYISSFVVSLVFEWVLFAFVIALNWHGLETAIYAAVVGALYIAGLTGIMLTFGIVGAKLDWSDPRRMTTGSAGCLSAIVGIVYIGLAWLFFFVPPTLFAVFGLPEWLGQAIGLVVGGAFSLVCAYIPLRQSLARVEKIGMA